MSDPHLEDMAPPEPPRKAAAAPEQPPGWRERWWHASSLFVFFLLLALVFRVCDKFEEMFREMNLAGGLPQLTCYLLEARRLAVYTFAPLMFIVCWCFFSWVAKRRERLWLFSTLLVILTVLGGICVVVALFLPLIGTYDRIGK